MLRRGPLSRGGVFVLLVAGCAPRAAETPPEEVFRTFPAVEAPRAEILRDTWGVPHIFARDAPSLFYAFGWSQMRSHGELLLRLYGQARGRAAEYWGEAYLEDDRWVRTNDIPGRAEAWLAEQSPEARAFLESFTRGVNEYARDHAAELADSLRAVLPITPADILAHTQNVLHYTFVTSRGSVRAAVRAWQAGEPVPVPGPAAASNAWAVAPSRSASGNAMLLANPHLPWAGPFTWIEVHLVAPGIDATGAALAGFPLPGIAFNNDLGWTFTVNPIDGADLYELTLEGDGYHWDGGVRAFESRQETLRVREANGSLREERIVVRSSVHGPVLAENGGRALALRVAGLDASQLLDQNWDMLRAGSLEAFERAIARLQLPLFNVLYADRAGHILYVYHGRLPERARGDWREWSGIVRGDTSATLWTTTHPYASLPRVLDPGSGWLQNANDPPWTVTFPRVLDAAHYPAWFAPAGGWAFRPQRSARMLLEDERIGFDELIGYKHSTRMEVADHMLDDVVVAARASGNPVARLAADVLAAWDRRADADSRGAVLFQAFHRELARRSSGELFEIPWLEQSPFTTPDGLADPEQAVAALVAAAAQVENRHGALDVAWGEVHRLRRDSLDLPGNGGPDDLGIFRVTDFRSAGDGRYEATGGDSWVAAIEFGSPVRARALLSWGNELRAGSPHRTDQLVLYAEQRLRPVWRTRSDVEANTTDRIVFRQ